MKLIVFGATGTIGRHVTEQALTAGHQVTAFARHPAALELTHANLTLASGNVLDQASVARTIEGHEAALISLGSGRKGTVRSVGTKHVIEGMQAHGVRRLICQTTLGCGDSWSNLNVFWQRVMFGWFIKAVFEDHEKQEAFVRASSLDWTLVRPSAFTDGPATGSYQHGFPPTHRDLSLKISRADVAGFMLDQLTSERYVLEAPGISN